MRHRLLRGPGAFALLALAALSIGAPSAQNATGQGRTVEYWVAAVPVTWNVVPNGRDAIGHMTFSPDKTGRKEHVRVLVRGRHGWSPATSAVFLVSAAR